MTPYPLTPDQEAQMLAGYEKMVSSAEAGLFTDPETIEALIAHLTIYELLFGLPALLGFIARLQVVLAALPLADRLHARRRKGQK
jgi:hypothetical protein